MDSFHDYDKHFTVMNYRSESELRHIESVDFIPLFEQQHPNYSWKDTEETIFQMLRELFQSACSKEYPAGIANFSLVRKSSFTVLHDALSSLIVSCNLCC